MKKFALLAGICALALSLGGCLGSTNGTGGVNPFASIGDIWNVATGSAVTPQAVYVAANSFDAAENAAIVYDRLPTCGATQSAACKQLATVKTVDGLVRQGIIVRKQLVSAAASNPSGPAAISNYNALMTIVSGIQGYVTAANAAAGK